MKQKTLNKVTVIHGRTPIQLIEVRRKSAAWADVPRAMQDERVYRLKYIETGVVGRNLYTQTQVEDMFGETLKPKTTALPKLPPARKLKSKAKEVDEMDSFLSTMMED